MSPAAAAPHGWVARPPPRRRQPSQPARQHRYTGRVFMVEQIFVLYSIVHSGFASFHASRPLILFRDSERCILYCWPIFSKHKRRPYRRRRRKYPRKSVVRDSSEGDIYSSSNYYRQPQSTEDYRQPQSAYQEADYYQEASSSRREDSEAPSSGYKSWYAGDYTEAFSNSYNYQPSQSDSYPSSYRDRYTQNSEQYEPYNWESWDSKRFSR